MAIHIKVPPNGRWREGTMADHSKSLSVGDGASGSWQITAKSLPMGDVVKEISKLQIGECRVTYSPLLTTRIVSA
jgi:hypothetical protein